MNETIKQLLALQQRDLDIDKLQLELGKIPAAIEVVKKEIASARTALEGAKKDMTTAQLKRKTLELDLDTKESAVRKHSNELNSVKSNDAYRALVGEIDKAKQDKSVLEDQILQTMEAYDLAAKLFKEKEALAKSSEGDKLRQISDLETKQKELQESITRSQAERVEFAAAFPKGLGEQYERMRKARKGAAIVPLKAGQCSGCHMQVSQNLLNELRRGQKMLTCESCERIVYLEETPATEATPS